MEDIIHLKIILSVCIMIMQCNLLTCSTLCPSIIILNALIFLLTFITFVLFTLYDKMCVEGMKKNDATSNEVSEK